MEKSIPPEERKLRVQCWWVRVYQYVKLVEDARKESFLLEEAIPGTGHDCTLGRIWCMMFIGKDLLKERKARGLLQFEPYRYRDLTITEYVKSLGSDVEGHTAFVLMEFHSLKNFYPASSGTSWDGDEEVRRLYCSYYTGRRGWWPRYMYYVKPGDVLLLPGRYCLRLRKLQPSPKDKGYIGYFAGSAEFEGRIISLEELLRSNEKVNLVHATVICHAKQLAERRN